MKLGPGNSTHLMGTIVSIPHTISARTVAVLGYDFMIIDAQHTYVYPPVLGIHGGLQVESLLTKDSVRLAGLSARRTSFA